MKKRVSFREVAEVDLTPMELEIGHNLQQDPYLHGDLTSPSSWSSASAYEGRGTRDLLLAADLIELVAEMMVRTGPVKLHRLCPDLTLTVAALERLLYTYIEGLLLLQDNNQSGQSLQRLKQTLSSNLPTHTGHRPADRYHFGHPHQQPASLRGIAEEMRKCLPLLKRPEAQGLRKAFPRPSGGTCSLLYYLTCTLRATAQCLRDLDEGRTSVSDAMDDMELERRQQRIRLASVRAEGHAGGELDWASPSLFSVLPQKKKKRMKRLMAATTPLSMDAHRRQRGQNQRSGGRGSSGGGVRGGGGSESEHRDDGDHKRDAGGGEKPLSGDEPRAAPAALPSVGRPSESVLGDDDADEQLWVSSSMLYKVQVLAARLGLALGGTATVAAAAALAMEYYQPKKRLFRPALAAAAAAALTAGQIYSTSLAASVAAATATLHTILQSDGLPLKDGRWRGVVHSLVAHLGGADSGGGGGSNESSLNNESSTMSSILKRATARGKGNPGNVLGGGGRSGSGSSGRQQVAAATAAACLAVGVAAASAAQWHRRRVRRKLQRQLRECNLSLGVIMRLWTLNKYIVDAAALRRSGSYHLLHLDPSEEDDQQSGKMPTSRLLVERVPVPSIVAFWYDADPAISAFKRTMDVLYASMAGAQFAWDVGGRAVGVPVALGLVAWHFFCGDPAVASHAACLAMQRPRARFVRRSWGILNAPPVVAASQFLAWCRGLGFQRHVHVNGVLCHVYAAEEPPSWAQWRQKCNGGGRNGLAGARSGRGGGGSDGIIDDDDTDNDDGGALSGSDVLLYIHGGAFVATLHAADMGVLTEWAKRTGAVIIFPEYALAPEHRYPTGLNQLMSIYEAIDSKRVPRKGTNGGGSSFQHQSGGSKNGGRGGKQANSYGNDPMPWLRSVRNVAVAGESAGGNLAAALIVRILMHRQLLNGSASFEKLPLESAPSQDIHRNGYLQQHHDDDANEDNRRRRQRRLKPLRLPEGLLLAYPALNISLTPSPSRAVHNFDPVLPLGIMYSVLRMYPPASLRAAPYMDPCLSPYHCPDDILRDFPPTHLMVGGFDPLLDDAVDFDTRLRRLGVCSSLHVENALPHGFSGLIFLSKHARRAMETGTRFLEASCFKKNECNYDLSEPAPLSPDRVDLPLGFER